MIFGYLPSFYRPHVMVDALDSEPANSGHLSTFFTSVFILSFYLHYKLVRYICIHGINCNSAIKLFMFRYFKRL